MERGSIPVKISGTLTDPKIRPDLTGIAKAQVQKVLDDHKEEIDKVKDKAVDKAKDKLKDLLGGKKKSKDPAQGAGTSPAGRPVTRRRAVRNACHARDRIGRRRQLRRPHRAGAVS